MEACRPLLSSAEPVDHDVALVWAEFVRDRKDFSAAEHVLRQAAARGSITWGTYNEFIHRASEDRANTEQGRVLIETISDLGGWICWAIFFLSVIYLGANFIAWAGAGFPVQ